MAFVAPIAGALFGGLLTGWAGWGLSVGWLVGSWLFGPKAEEDNKVFDSGAEEMPTFNQALRGSSMPVLFGTNRVSSQIVWQKNFTVIRHESKEGGGGGKFGGSGMGNKGGGSESTNVSYEYKWDLMFHVGMSEEELSLFGGWCGPERINDSTILAITDGSGASIFRSASGNSDKMELAFESAFFHGALPTGDTNATNWGLFETEEGGAYRWPYTGYMGFKQMNLGGSAHVPQLTWEVGPGDVSVSAIDGDVSTKQGNHGLYDRQQYPFKGRDGKVYLLSDTGGASDGSFVIWDPAIDDYVYAPVSGLYVYSQADWQADISASGLTSAFSGAKSVSSFGTSEGHANVIIGEDGDYWITYHTSLASNITYCFWLLYQINESGEIELVGAYYSRNYYLTYGGFLGLSGKVWMTGAMTNDDSMAQVVGRTVGTGQTLMYLLRLPSINLMKGMLAEESPTYPLNTRIVQLNGGYDSGTSELATDDRPGQYASWDNFGYGTSYGLGTSQYGNHKFRILPYVAIGVGISWTNRFSFRLNYPKLYYSNQNPGAGSDDDTTYAIQEDYGYTQTRFAYFDFNDGGNSAAVVAPYTVLDDGWKIEGDSLYVDISGQNFLWDDECYDRDGNFDEDLDYQRETYVHRITSGIGTGAFLVIEQKLSNRSNDYGIFSEATYAKLRISIWNPITKQFTVYGTLETPYGDKSVSEPDGWGHYPFTYAQMISFSMGAYWDQTNSKLYIAGGPNIVPSGENLGIFEVADLTISGGEDVYPPYVIYKILTSSVYGLGFAESDIDSTSYGLALQYCTAEGISISVQYRREEGALAIIDELLSLYGGFLTDVGGKIKFGLQEFTTTPVRTIDNEHLRIDQDGEAPVKITKGARQDTYNKVKVNYFDRNLEYRQNFIELSDEVDMDINGVRPQEYPAKFVMSEATALKIATRALWSNLYARDIYSFKLGPRDADLEPGDVITLVDSFNRNLQAGKQVRIVEWQETQPLMFSVRAVDEIEYINTSTTGISSASEPSSNALFGPSHPPAYFQMYELPKEYQGADARLFVGYRQQSTAMGARLYVSADGVSFTQTDDVQPFIISGIIKSGLPSRDVGYVEENIEFYLFPDTRSGEFSTSSPSYCQTIALEDSSANGRALGASALWINSEMVAYEGATLLGQNHYRFDKLYRGWGGTHIQAHNSGDTWWRHAGGVFTQALNTDKVGNIFHYKVQPYNFAGIGYNISSIDAKTYQIQGTYWRPQNPGALRTFVQSPGSYLTIQSEDLNFITKKKVLTGGSPVQVEWPDTSRDSGYGALGYDYLTYGEFATDTTSHQYRIQVYSSDGTTVVRCTTVSTLAFLYTVDNNSTDFNGWAGSFRVKVTPYNTYGDSLRSRTKILELFE